MSYTYYQAKNPTTININDEHVTESELPERLLELNNKTQNINANGTTLSNISTINTHNFNDMYTTVDDLFMLTRDVTYIDDGLKIPKIQTVRITIPTGFPSFSIMSNIGGETIANFDNDDRSSTFTGELTATNISSTNKTDIEALQTKTQNINADGSVLSNIVTLNGNKIGTPSSFIYKNIAPYIPICNTTGIIEVGSGIDFHDGSTNQDTQTRLASIGTNILEIQGTSSSLRLGRLDVNNGIDLRTPNLIMHFYKNDLTTSMLTLNAATNTATFIGNIVAPNLTGIAYNSNFCIQGSDYTQVTTLNNHLYIELTAGTYVPHMGLRIHKTNLSNGQEMMLQVGKDNTRAISFVYRHYDTIANSQYRLDFAGKSAYICNYGATTTEHEIRGNLKVFGSVTQNASKTITHYTMYEGDLQPGFFVESTGQIFRNGETSYENCMVTVRQATTFTNNIIGVCTEIMNEEVTDDYGNVNQPAGKYCKFATHGDCLIKCESATYTCGDIIVPSTNGFGKKGSSTDVLNCMLSMTPRLKVTSVDTDEIDPQCVVGFITV